jgi:SAM-dependent methyltransferase
MGDRSRFRLFAQLIAERFPDRKARIADVACGKGQLHSELHLLGYRNVVSWDKRKRNLRRLSVGFRYEWFDYRNAPRGYDLVVGMHPDEGTDHIILYAAKHKVPFLVCPCCVLPSAAEYGGQRACYTDWMRHLVGLARSRRMTTDTVSLPMDGRKQVIVGGCR